MNNASFIETRYSGSDGCPLYAATLEATERDTARLPVFLLHGGGPDHHSMIPLARYLADHQRIILPDIRGYGLSVCRDPDRHTWAQYVDDVATLLDHLHIERVVLGGTGIGTTISLRTAIEYPDRIAGLVLISIEDIEDDTAKAAEIELLDAFAERVRSEGLAAAWEPILAHMAPIIGALVRDALTRSDPASIAAAAAIGRDRSFRDVAELAVIQAPALIFPGMDYRHPAALAEIIAALLPRGSLAKAKLGNELRSAEALAHALGPAISSALNTWAD